jgi:hypothetical protein
MEDLFSTNITINNESIRYHVVFDHENYIFHLESDNKSFPDFSLKRAHDEWHEQGSLLPEIKQQAVDALERYLMKQH